MEWKDAFYGYGAAKGFAECLTNRVEAHLPRSQLTVLDPDADADKPRIAARSRNAKAMNAFRIAFAKCPEGKAIIRRSKEADWQAGLAWRVVEALENKYEVADEYTPERRERAWKKVSLGSNEDPMLLFSRIEDVELRFNHQYTDEEKFSKVLKCVNKTYRELLMNERRRLRLQGVGFTVAEMESLLDDRYKAEQALEEIDESTDEEAEVAAAVVEDKKKVKCGHCGKNGHTEDKCWKKHGYPEGKTPRGGRGSGGGSGNNNPHKNKTCNSCGKKGHISANCWDKPGNKAPQWYTDMKNKKAAKGDETANAAVDDDEASVEFMCVGIDVDNDHISTTTANVDEVVDRYREGYVRFYESDDETTVDGSAEEEEYESDSVYTVDTATTTFDSESEEETFGWMSRVEREVELMVDRQVFIDPMEEMLDGCDIVGMTIGGRFKVDWNWKVGAKKRVKARFPIECANLDDYGSEDEIVCVAASKLAFPSTSKLLQSPNVWIADTGASIHMTSHIAGMKNVRTVSQGITMGNSHNELAGRMGDIRGRICNKFGEVMDTAVLKDVALIAKGFNLFSLSRMQVNGWKLHGDDKAIWIEKDGKVIRFDIKIQTSRGAVFAAFIQRELGSAGVAVDGSRPVVSISYDTAHDLLGHMGEDATRKSAKHLGWTVTGTPSVCSSCAVAKAKQKSLPKVSLAVPLKDGERRIHLDVSTIKKMKEKEGETVKQLAKPNWLMIVDAESLRKWSSWHAKKDDIVGYTCQLFKAFEQANRRVTYLRMDNAGENQRLAEELKSSKWKMAYIKIEFTPRDTPQMNSLAEVSFSSIGDKVRAVLTGANVPKKERHYLFPKCVLFVTQVDNLVAKDVDGKLLTRYELNGEPIPAFADNLRTFGEAVVVKTKTKTTPKPNNKGVLCMFVGYPEDHGRNTYRCYNPLTKGVHTSRDAVFLRRMYYGGEQRVNELIVSYEHVADGSVSTQNTTDTVQNAVPAQTTTNRTVVPTRNDALNTGEQATVNPFQEVRERLEEGRDSNNNEESANDNEESEAPEASSEVQEDGSREAQNTTEGNREEAGVTPTYDRGVRVPGTTITTRSGRSSKPASEMGSAGLLTSQEQNYYACLLELGLSGVETVQNSIDNEFSLVGAALGGGFMNTAELIPMKFDEAMQTKDRKSWMGAVKEEFDRMMKYKVFRLVPRNLVPRFAKILTSTWAMKKKSNGTFRARLTARGYEQRDGEHFDSDSVASPTINITTVRVMWVIMLLMRGCGYLVDVNGAFLLGGWEHHPITNEKRKIHMEVPQGFKEFLPKGDWILLLEKTLYGAKQASKQFWLLLLATFKMFGFKYNRVDPCLYYRWDDEGLVLWSSWVDDCLNVSPNRDKALQCKDQLMGAMDCDDTGVMREYVGCMTEYNPGDGTLLITQPVLLQSFADEFELPKDPVETPAIPGQSLQETEFDDALDATEQRLYRKGVGKLLHCMRWSRVDLLNAVRELSRFMGRANQAHMKALLRVLRFAYDTRDCGLHFKVHDYWNGKSLSFMFVVSGICDSEYCKDQSTRHSVGGCITRLNGIVVSISSKMQKIVALSVCEAELIQAVECAQDMLFVYRLLREMNLTVELPMILECDNQGAIDLCNNWSSGGRTRHIDVRLKFLREMKEANVIRMIWRCSEDNEADVLTKNLSTAAFKKHNSKFMKGKYYNGQQNDEVMKE